MMIGGKCVMYISFSGPMLKPLVFATEGLFCHREALKMGGLRWLPVVLAVAASEPEECASWAGAGECERNPDYMLKECASACGPGAASFYDLTARTADGEALAFERLRGKVVLVTNVASA